MQKAFLSHSSLDKDEVRLIKQQLGRYFTYFDEDCFEPGEDFRTAIVKRLETTSLFVLFASHASLASAWVQFELDEAYWQRIKNKNIDVVVLALEKIEVSELPAWMQRGKFESISNFRVAAQIIKSILFRQNPDVEDLYFGREKDTDDFVLDMETCKECFPSIIALSGLEGIGRKSFAQNVFRSRFSLYYRALFRLDDGQNIGNLYQQIIADGMEKFSSKEMEEEMLCFQDANFEDKIARIADSLSQFSDKQVCPIIIDGGALLDDNGQYRSEFKTLFSYFSQTYPDHYLVLIHSRRPIIQFDDRSIYSRQLKALNLLNTQALFKALLHRKRVEIDDQKKVNEIASYLDGYPPAAIYAAQECAFLSIDTVCADKRFLTDFKCTSFNKYLDAINLSESDYNVLRYIYQLETCTLDSLAVLIGESEENTAHLLRKYCDNNIVVFEGRILKIAPPISAAIGRRCKFFTENEFSAAAHILIDAFWNDINIPSLEILNLLIYVTLRANLDEMLNEFKSFILPSNLFKAAQKAYIERRYEQAEKYSYQALALDSSLDEVRILLFKALVRQENKDNFSKEEALIDNLNKHHNKYIYYLLGFRERKRHKFHEAIKYFLEGKRAGDNSIQIQRDLAECFYHTNQVDKAQEAITQIWEDRKIKNPFIIDLACKIAIENEDFIAVEEFLPQLESIDKPANFHHRYATYWMRKKDYPKAYLEAKEACESNDSLPEMHTLLMNIFIHLKNYPEAEKKYKYIKDNLKWYNRNLLEGLYITMILQRDGWEKAEEVFNKIMQRPSSIHISLKKKILEQKIENIQRLPLILQKNTIRDFEEISKQKAWDFMTFLPLYEGREDQD